MKDITITGKRIKTEIIFVIVSFCLAVLLNVHAITKFNSPWSELFSEIHIVLIISVVIYALLVLVRLIIWAIVRLFSRPTE
jgi:phosphotransferase system  glucose/maltose/N-acetylglucosamine-specific IIC component